MIEKIKYKLNKISKFINRVNQLISIYLYKNRNKEFEEIIKQNRKYLKSIDSFLTKKQFLVNDYGIPKDLYNHLDKPINIYPTYTDLFYSSPTTIGNQELKLETAITKEIGLKYKRNNLNINLSLYQRDASNIIDYVKNEESDPWQANNIREIITNGVELNMGYIFYLGNFREQSINIGFSNIDDNLLETDFTFSRYALNSLKNHITATYSFEINEKISSTIAFKNAERVNDKKYSVIDFRSTYNFDKFTLSVILNNILDAEYSETNLVPMPGFNSLAEVKYSF